MMGLIQLANVHIVIFCHKPRHKIQHQADISIHITTTVWLMIQETFDLTF